MKPLKRSSSLLAPSFIHHMTHTTRRQRRHFRDRTAMDCNWYNLRESSEGISGFKCDRKRNWFAFSVFLPRSRWWFNEVSRSGSSDRIEADERSHKLHKDWASRLAWNNNFCHFGAVVQLVECLFRARPSYHRPFAVCCRWLEANEQRGKLKSSIET